MNQLIWGALAMSCWTAGLFFLHFWKLSRDRLFFFFFLGFWSFGVHWVGLTLINPSLETRHYLYLVRLVAYAFIIIGIVDKNRRHRSDAP